MQFFSIEWSRHRAALLQQLDATPCANTSSLQPIQVSAREGEGMVLCKIHQLVLHGMMCCASSKDLLVHCSLAHHPMTIPKHWG